MFVWCLFVCCLLLLCLMFVVCFVLVCCLFGVVFWFWFVVSKRKKLKETWKKNLGGGR